MEKSTLVGVTCPNCDKEGELLKHEIIDITKNPSMRTDIINRQIFTYTCPYCGEKIAVSYDCIYMDTENKHCIALITTGYASFASFSWGKAMKSKIMPSSLPLITAEEIWKMTIFISILLGMMRETAKQLFPCSLIAIF